MAESIVQLCTCCICEEVYDEFNRKPLLLPCTHSFCTSCLQQMQTNNEKHCPICRSDWTEHSTDSLIFIRQLVPSRVENNEIFSKTDKIKSPLENECINHVFAFWCNSCEISICKRCLKEDHKLCDWILEEDRIDELGKVLQKATLSSRTYLTDSFLRGAADNTTNLTNVRGLIKRLLEHEKCFMSLESSIKIETDAAMNCLKELENQPAHASVVDYMTAISRTSSLHDDHIQYPNVLDFSFLFNSKDFAVPEIETKSAEDPRNEVSDLTD